jgi:hypothetical protein
MEYQRRDAHRQQRHLRPKPRVSSMINFVTAGNTMIINMLRTVPASVPTAIHGYRFK